jgi:GDP-D-mannose dehydratase
MRIHTVEYNYKDNVENMNEDERRRKRVGILAQEIEQILPGTISYVEENGLTDQRLFNADELTFLLVNATQEQQKLIEEQQKTIEELVRQMQILMELLKQNQK